MVLVCVGVMCAWEPLETAEVLVEFESGGSWQRRSGSLAFFG
jgi:hypothetical protein